MSATSITSSLPPSETGTEEKDVDSSVAPVRDINKLFSSSFTIRCAFHHGCVPCAYKIGCFDVARDSAFCKAVPNQRPEQCPRANSKTLSRVSLVQGGQTLGYRAGMSVLTVGDGDFSFSLAIARFLSYSDDHSRSSDATKKLQLVATSYESKETLCNVYPMFEKTTSELESLGAVLYFEIDATNLDDTLPVAMTKPNRQRFHRIIWNFPCTAVSEGQDGQNDAMDRNKELVRLFVENARRFAVNGGEIHMCHKTKPPFNQWRLEKVAVELCSEEVTYTGRIVLDRCLLPPYQPRKAKHSKSFPCHDACIYIFQICHDNSDEQKADATLPEPVEYDLTTSLLVESSPALSLFSVTQILIHAIRERFMNKAGNRQICSTDRRRQKKRQRRD